MTKVRTVRSHGIRTHTSVWTLPLRSQANPEREREWKQILLPIAIVGILLRVRKEPIHTQPFRPPKKSRLEIIL